MLGRPHVVHGQCACARVEFAAHAVEQIASVCYCETCRRASGGAGIAWLNVDEASLRVNGDVSQWRSSDGVRSFCPNCGGQLVALNHSSAAACQVAVGALDDESVVAGTRSIHVEQRTAWDAAHTLRGQELQEEADVLPSRPATHGSREDARLTSLLASAPDAFVTIDPHGLICEWSPRAEATFGWSYAEAIRQPLHELIIPPEMRSAHIRGLSRLQRTGHGPVLGRRFDVEALRKDGSRIPVELYVAPMSMNGQMGATAFLKDLRPQRAADAELRSMTELLQRTGDLASVGGWVVDLRSEEVLWSPGARRIHGVDEEFVPTPTNVAAFYSLEALGALQAVFQQGVTTGERWELEVPVTTAAGKAIWVRAIGDTEFDERGNALRVVGAVQDITEHKLLEARLAANELFLLKVTDNLPVRIGYLDRDGRYRFANRANCERLKAPRSQVIGKTRVELLGARANESGAEHLNAALAGKHRKFEQAELVDGHVIHTESQLIPDVDENGSVQGIFTIGVDITERKAAEESLQVLAQIFDATPDFVVQADRDGRVTYMNPAVRQAVGIASDADVSGYSFLDFNTPETTKRYRSEIIPEVMKSGAWLGETTVVVAAGTVPVNHMVLAHRDATGQVVRYSSVMRDISQTARARAQVFRQRRTLSSIAEAVPTFIAVVDKEARYEFANKAFQELLGRTKEEIIGKQLGAVLNTREVTTRLSEVEQALSGVGSTFELDMFLGGSQRNLTVTLKPRRSEDGEPDGFVAILDDITVQKQRESRLLMLSERDALTGLANRQGFESFLRSIPPAQMLGTAMLYIDLDRFKPVNDSHGHAAGDLLLKAFASRLQALVRPTDLVARLGGDEFVVVLTGLPSSHPAETVADKVVAAAAEPFSLQDLVVQVGASVGVAMGEADDWKGLLEKADAALYRAKAAGRGTRA